MLHYEDRHFDSHAFAGHLQARSCDYAGNSHSRVSRGEKQHFSGGKKKIKWQSWYEAAAQAEENLDDFLEIRRLAREVLVL